MREFGLIGYPLEHSFSQAHFTQKFEREKINNTVYHNFPLKSIADLSQLLKDHPNLQGFNVTIPYKEQVIPLLNKVTEHAEKIGAVNTIRIRSGKLEGFNTDYVGFLRSLKPLLKPHHQKALVLGTGGAAKAVGYVLDMLQVGYLSVSRNPEGNEIDYRQINEQLLQEYPIIINTTPLGMHPRVDEAPDLPYQVLSEQHLLYDLVYNPAKTKFLQLGEAQGTTIKNGHEMLMIQAEEAWKIWNSF